MHPEAFTSSGARLRTSRMTHSQSITTSTWNVSRAHSLAPMAFTLIGNERGSGMRFCIKVEDLQVHVPLRFDVFDSKDRLLIV